MEVQPGFFVSSISTDAWEPDLEVGGQMHVLCSGVGIDAGLSRFGVESDPLVRWTLPDRETVLVLEGKATIEVVGGPTLELKAGDIASLPKGAQTTWRLTLPFKEFWVLGPSDAAP
jgi:ethanolamine utilization protein EutQ (cupin superfamily)